METRGFWMFRISPILGNTDVISNHGIISNNDGRMVWKSDQDWQKKAFPVGDSCHMGHMGNDRHVSKLGICHFSSNSTEKQFSINIVYPTFWDKPAFFVPDLMADLNLSVMLRTWCSTGHGPWTRSKTSCPEGHDTWRFRQGFATTLPRGTLGIANGENHSWDKEKK